MLDYPKVKKLLRKHGFTQKEVASELGVSATSVSDWMKGISQPSKENLEGLSDFLECPVEELTTNEPQISVSDRGVIINIHCYCESQTIQIQGDRDPELTNENQNKKRLTLDIEPDIVEKLQAQGDADISELLKKLLHKHLSE